MKTIKLLFDKSATKRQIENVLTRMLPIIGKRFQHLVEKTPSGQTEVTIENPSVRQLDRAQAELTLVAIKNKWRFLRLRDDAGFAIRNELYPLLAEMEQGLREFIERAMGEVAGADWWSNNVDKELRQKIVARQKKAGSELLSPLECLDFEDVIELITHTYTQSSLSNDELEKIFSENQNPSDLKSVLRDRLLPKSLWDNVFAAYFSEIDKWEEMKGSLIFVVTVRHKVMHHRPVRYAVIKAVDVQKQKLGNLLESAKPKLPEPEKKQAQKEVKQVAYGQPLSTSILGGLDIAAIVGSQLKPATEAMLNSTRGLSSAFVGINQMNDSIREMALSLTKSIDTSEILRSVNTMNEQLRKSGFLFMGLRSLNTQDDDPEDEEDDKGDDEEGSTGRNE